MQTPTDSKLVDGPVYSVISEHWVHSEQIRWTLLSNFLTANSILLVAWATIYIADGTPPPWTRTCVLVAFASVGLFLSLVWVGIVLRSGKFVKMYADFGCKVEGQMQTDPGPFTSAEILPVGHQRSSKNSQIQPSFAGSPNRFCPSLPFPYLRVPLCR